MANTRAILMMTLAMVFFAGADTFIKLSSQTVETGQILLLSGIGSLALFLPMLWRDGTKLFHRDALQSAVLVRTVGETVGSLGVVVSISLIPLATASALMQAQPLAVTLGAVLFLGEKVGWRRWMAVCLGFLGVLIILRPGADGFDPNALWTLVGIIGLTARDLGTRRVPSHISTPFVSTWATIAIIFLGAAIMPFEGGWQPIAPITWVWLAGISVTVTLAFLAITAALRTGEVSAIAPFRYTRIVFAITIAFILFGERPDAITWAGAALIIGSGLYAFWRERRVQTARPKATSES